MFDQAEDRREFLKKAGTVAWATPFILTLASSRANAQSCAPAGSPCGTFVPALNQCVPTNAVICCGSCEPVNDDFCFCAA